MTRIEMHAPNPAATSLVWAYRLGYARSTVSGRSLLTSIEKRGALGGCLTAKRFDWVGQPLSRWVRVDGVGGFTEIDLSRSRPVDIDADGQVELLAVRQTGEALATSQRERGLLRWAEEASRFEQVGEAPTSGACATAIVSGDLRNHLANDVVTISPRNWGT